MKKRIGWIDIAKGITIILMIIGHTIPYTDITVFIFSFHMPLFVILSGVTYKMPKDKNDLKSRIKKYCKQLLVPYILTLFICTAIFTYINDDFSLLNVAKQFTKNLCWGNGCDYTLFGIHFNGVSPIWFLITLFLSKIVFDIINYKINNKVVHIHIVIYCFLALIGILIGRCIWLPQNLDLVLIFLLYLYIGFLFKKYFTRIDKYKAIIFVACFTLWTICLGMKMHIEFAVRGYPMYFLSIIESISASYCVIELCKILEKNRMLKLFLTNTGKISLIILCIHSIESVAINWKDIPLNIYLVTMLRVVTVLLLSFLFYFGKKKVIEQINQLKNKRLLKL